MSEKWEKHEHIGIVGWCVFASSRGDTHRQQAVAQRLYEADADQIIRAHELAQQLEANSTLTADEFVTLVNVLGGARVRHIVNQVRLAELAREAEPHMSWLNAQRGKNFYSQFKVAIPSWLQRFNEVEKQ